MTVSWEHNPEPDFAGYIVCHGTESGIYSSCVAVGQATVWTFAGLAAGQQYYFAVQAYDQSGLTGDFSNEVSTIVTPATGAELTAPVPGSMLPAPTAQFAWTGAKEGSTFRLSIGTTLGAADLLDRDMATSLSASVTGLPTDDGIAVYVRLWTLTGAELVHTDYSYLTARTVVMSAETTVHAGDPITVTVANAPGRPTDWVGLFVGAADNNAPLSRSYLNGLTTAPAIGVSGATLLFNAPLVLGTYELRLVSGNSLDTLATSAPIVVESRTSSATADGSFSYGGLTIGPDNQVYGTAAFGGLTGQGTVFLVNGSGEFVTLHDFASADGASPYAALTFGDDGNLYGTTQYGGTNGVGTIFTMTRAGSLATLHNFSRSDGEYPIAGVSRGTDGRLYGVTPYGGAYGHGTVYGTDTNGTLTTLHDFTGADGGGPFGALVQASDGRFYGTTTYGGTASAGTVFKIDPAGSFQSVHDFSGMDGASPEAALIQAIDGALYGTTTSGGSNAHGTIFRIDGSGVFAKLHDFIGSDGSSPRGRLLEVNTGTFYGSTTYGGATGQGTVFSVDAAGVLTTLHAFQGADGAHPVAGLVGRADGALYGTTVLGGPADRGVLFGFLRATELAVAAATGPFGGATVLAATLTSNGAPLANKTIDFALDRVLIGSAVTDASGVATLTDVSLAGLNAGTYVGAAGAGSSAQGFHASGSAADLVVTPAAPTMRWNAPAAIVYGTALDATQLNATATVPGTFAYSPPIGAVLHAGAAQPLSVVFTPTDTTNYTNATAAVSIEIVKASPTVLWNSPADIAYGTALGATQLNATATVPGTFDYTPLAGAILHTGAAQPLSVVFTPTDVANYSTAIATVSINVVKATPTVLWNSPADIVYGTALGATQLNATATVPGTFDYSPPMGTVLHAGAAQTLSVIFTATDTTNYATATAAVSIAIGKASPTVVWNTLADIVYGTALGATQLNATATVPGSFDYTPPLGTILNAGPAQPLSGVFTPTDADNYTTATASVLIDVLNAATAVTPATDMVNPGGTITFTITDGPGQATDWVGLFSITAADTDFVDWMFLNGSRTSPETGVAGATLQFTAPSIPGTYNLRFFSSNSFIRLSTSPTITVQ